jgi:hypothetical protein
MKFDYNGSYINVTCITTLFDYNTSYFKVTFIPTLVDYNASYFIVTVGIKVTLKYDPL